MHVTYIKQLKNFMRIHSNFNQEFIAISTVFHMCKWLVFTNI